VKIQRPRLMRHADLEKIGRLSIDAYIAGIARFNAKNWRATERRNHPCIAEGEYSEDGHQEQLCWMGASNETWCENCKHCQPYHEVYIRAAKESSKAKNKLVRYIKLVLLSESEE
jgi:hypothetical protein